MKILTDKQIADNVRKTLNELNKRAIKMHELNDAYFPKQIWEEEMKKITIQKNLLNNLLKQND